MKKVLFVVVATAVALTSYAEKNLFSENNKKPAPRKTQKSKAGAVPFHSKETIVWDGQEFYNPCTDELMTLTGETQFTVHGIVNKKKSKISYHINVQGISAVSESGRHYRIAGANNSKESFFANGLFVTKMVRNERWTTAGGKNNYIIRESFFITVDAEGNVSVKKENFEAYCQ